MERKALRIKREVWPVAAARQWDLTFPQKVRYCLAYNPDFLNDATKVVENEIGYFYERIVTRDESATATIAPY